MLEGHFQFVHKIRFSEPTKIGSLKTDRVNPPLESLSDSYKAKVICSEDNGTITLMLTLKQTDVQLEYKARVDSLYHIIGQTLTGS